MVNTNSFDSQWMRRARILTQALIVSGALNIGFFATFVYIVLKEKQAPVALERKPFEMAHPPNPVLLTNDRFLSAYSLLPFQELFLRLENKELLEEGYMKRDLALACLVAFHHFNLERALGGLALQQRQLFFTSPLTKEIVEISTFPGLSDYQYQAIIQYGRMEKWPLTSKGLFLQIKKAEQIPDPTLLEAFYLSPEVHAVATLFARSGFSIEKGLFAKMLAEGEWKMLEDFFSRQRQLQDLSQEKRRCFLLDFIHAGSKTAAKLLIETDREFALKRLSDAEVLNLLALCTEKNLLVETFAKQLVLSPRSDAVLKKAAQVLYLFSNEPLPDPYDHQTALLRFVPEASHSKKSLQASFLPLKDVAPSSSRESGFKRTHIVQEGDSLWKIAHMYHVSIESIMRLNNLESEKLRRGSKLEIPDR
ncbi:MAG: LysM peptidoglycan-binding domain-containing protein [Anaerolineae bacterium]